MFNSTYTRSLGKAMVILFSMALLCILSVGSTVASAQTIQRAVPAPHQSITHKVHHDINLPCAPQITKYYDEFCFTPHVSHYCDPLYTNYDNNNQLVDWTDVDKYRDCINVTYDYTSALNSCNVYFYVPNGYGNTTLAYYLNGDHTHKYYIDEAVYSNYTNYSIFEPVSSGYMSFATNEDNGKAIGWGAATSDGLEEICTN